MLGLLIFPREGYVRHIPAIPLAKLLEDGWPAPKVKNGFPQVTDLRELIRYLRNAIAHFNIEFLTDESRQITGLKVWNTCSRSRQKTWEADLSLEGLRNIAENFINLLLKE